MSNRDNNNFRLFPVRENNFFQCSACKERFFSRKRYKNHQCGGPEHNKNMKEYEGTNRQITRRRQEGDTDPR